MLLEDLINYFSILIEKYGNKKVAIIINENIIYPECIENNCDDSDYIFINLEAVSFDLNKN